MTRRHHGTNCTRTSPVARFNTSLLMSQTDKQKKRSSSTGNKKVWNKLFKRPCYGHWIMEGRPEKCVPCPQNNECMAIQVTKVKRAFNNTQAAKLRMLQTFLNKSKTVKQKKVGSDS